MKYKPENNQEVPPTILVTPKPQDEIDVQTVQLAGTGGGYKGRTEIAEYVLQHADRLGITPAIGDKILEGALDETGIRHVGSIPVGVEVLQVEVPNPDYQQPTNQQNGELI